MERTSKLLPLWRKKTFEDSPRNIGKMYLRGFRTGMIKPNEKIRATAEQLGKFRDEFVLVDEGDYKVQDEPSVKEETKEAPVKTQPVKGEVYNIVHTKAGWFDVVSESGKKMNDKALREAAAKELKAALEEETIVEE